jgi:Flp pilus assembly protein TadB
MVMLVVGWFLIVLAPVVGALPGPGGIFVFAAGMILLLRNSCWARRNYVLFKRRFPKIGHACDKVMRRGSTLRRLQRVKACRPQPD